MTLIFEDRHGYYISHKKYIDEIYKNVDNHNYYLNEKLFEIFCPYQKTKSKKLPNNASSIRKEMETNQQVKQKFMDFVKILKEKGHFAIEASKERNLAALEAAEFAYLHSGKDLIQNSFGSNAGSAKVQIINESQFLFPQNCEFFCKDVSEISIYLGNNQFDFIILDPPWWNKYIRRKRKKSDDGYKMMYNSELRNIPIETLLKKTGLIAVWCTNSVQNIEELMSVIFPKWGLKLTAVWFWVKVTLTGEPICNFSHPPGKQPYERIIFGSRQSSLPVLEDGKLVVSVPSAIHSHKPPLIDLLKPYLPEQPVCLEIFARYLLPNFTSYGNESLRLQHESLFTKEPV